MHVRCNTMVSKNTAHDEDIDIIPQEEDDDDDEDNYEAYCEFIR